MAKLLVEDQVKNTHVENQENDEKQGLLQKDKQRPAVWDCGSTLYDSFELKSFERQLYSAINSRTMSMSHLPDRKVAMAAPPAPSSLPATCAPVCKKPSKISRSLHKFLKSMFKPRTQNPSPAMLRVQELAHREKYVYDKSGALTTIPEVPENDHHGGVSPDINSFVRRTASERFSATSTSIGITCA